MSHTSVVLVQVSNAAIKLHYQMQLGEERVYFSLSFYITVHCSGKSGQELKGESGGSN